jgi:hypothetical protein
LYAFNKHTCAEAAAAGQLVALRHLIKRGCDWGEEHVAHHAVSSGGIDVMAWLRQQPGTVIDAEAMSSAAGT